MKPFNAKSPLVFHLVVKLPSCLKVKRWVPMHVTSSTCIPVSTPVGVGSILRLDNILILISLIVSIALVMM